MTRLTKICSGVVLFVALITLGACGGDSPASPTTTATAPAATNPTTDLLMSACFTHMGRADVRIALAAMGKSANVVARDLGVFDSMVATGHCN